MSSSGSLLKGEWKVRLAVMLLWKNSWVQQGTETVVWQTCYFCNTFHWRTWSALINVQLLIRRIIISVFTEWEWEIKMPFLKLQTILWQGNELSFLSKEHPPSVLWLSPGAPTGHPSRNVKFALIPEKWIVNVPPLGALYLISLAMSSAHCVSLCFCCGWSYGK